MIRRWNIFKAASDSSEEKKKAAAEEEEERKNGDKVFLAAMGRDGKFEEAMSVLDELDDGTAKRLLGWAAHAGKPPDVIRKIGERCGDISGWALERCTAIQLAIQTENVSGVRELLRMGADVNSESGNTSVPTALHWAVLQASMPCVELLLEQADIEVDATNSDGCTALTMCSVFALQHEEDVPEEIFAEIAAALLYRGADMNKREEGAESDHSTPLMHAIESGMCLIVTKMLELGRKPPASVVDGIMELMRESGRDYEPMLEVLVRAGWGPRVAGAGNPRGAAALRDIQDALKASPSSYGSFQQRSSSSSSSSSSTGNRPQPPSLPLHDAAKSGNVVALAELLSSGADVNAVDKHGGTALHAAAMHGHDDVVEALLRADGIVVDKPDVSKLTALFRAAVGDQAGAVKALLDAGASPHVKDQKGAPLLHKVLARPAGPILEALLAKGASPGAGGEKGITPLHVACMLGKRGTVEALLRAGALPGHCWNEALQSPLVLACRHGNLNAVQQLLPRLSKRQRNMRSGAIAGAETALGAAIRCTKPTMDTVAIVEALLEAGADPRARSGPMHVPPLALVLCVKPEFGAVNGVAKDPTIGPLLVKALVARGAEVNHLAVDQCGFTPFQLACYEGACAEVMQALLDAGADMLAPCLWLGMTSPLLLAACAGGNVGAVRLLIDQPQSGGLNALGGQDGDTPLSAAVQGGKTEVVRYLLEKGADMDLLPFAEDGKTMSKTSLIEMAASHGYMDVMRLLIQAKMFKDKAEQQAEDANNAKGAEETALR